MHRSVSFLAAAGVAILTLAVALTGCQSLSMPTPSPTATSGGTSSGQNGGSGADAVDVSKVTGAEPSEGLVDPCTLLTTAEVEAATGVKVLGVVRGAVHSDGSQVCAYAMDATGAPAAALAGVPGLPGDSSLGAVVNGMKGAGGVIGIILAAQDPEADYGGSDSGDAPPPQLDVKKLSLGKGAVVVGTPNGGAGFAANTANVLLTVMDLIAGPASTTTLSTLLTTAYHRLES